MRVEQFPRFPSDAGQLIRKLTDLFAQYGNQLNSLTEGRINAITNAATGIPTTGTFATGDMLRNSAPSETGSAPNTYVVWGWVCTAGGTPGTWEALNIPTSVFGGSGASWTEVEVDFGSAPVYTAQFSIADAAISTSSKVQVLPCGKAATGRTADDWLWDGATFAASPATASATCFAVFTPGPVVGKRKIQYSVGA